MRQYKEVMLSGNILISLYLYIYRLLFKTFKKWHLHAYADSTHARYRHTPYLVILPHSPIADLSPIGVWALVWALVFDFIPNGSHQLWLSNGSRITQIGNLDKEL